MPPLNQPHLPQLLAEYEHQLDAAFIITPHVCHHDQAKACLEAGLDVLLEKLMVMNVAEAERESECCLPRRDACAHCQLSNRAGNGRACGYVG